MELLVLYLERSVLHEMLPGPQTVIQFEFNDLEQLKSWWLVVTEKGVDVCEQNPGYDVNVYFNTTVKVMADIWLDPKSYKEAINNNELTIIGDDFLTRNVGKWLSRETFVSKAVTRAST